MPQLLQPSSSVRSRFTKKQLRDRVRSELSMMDTVFIRDTDVDNWLVEFQNILARDEEWYRLSETFFTSGDVAFYDMPADCITLSIVQYGVWRLPHITLEDLLMQYPLALAGTYKGPLPWYYTVDGDNRLMFFPTPTVASGVLTIYSALPPEPVGDDDFYYWPPYCDTLAIYYGSMRGAMKDLGREGAKRVPAFTAAYEREYRKAADKLRSRGQEATIIFGKRAAGKYPGPLYNNIYPKNIPPPG